MFVTIHVYYILYIFSSSSRISGSKVASNIMLNMHYFLASEKLLILLHNDKKRLLLNKGNA